MGTKTIGNNLLFVLTMVIFVIFGTTLAILFQLSFVFEVATEVYLGEEQPILGSALLQLLFTPASSSIAAIGTAGFAVWAYYSHNRLRWSAALGLTSISIAGFLIFVTISYLSIMP